ncbi:unnamed protein product, partial [Ilex paraguariensis]
QLWFGLEAVRLGVLIVMVEGGMFYDRATGEHAEAPGDFLEELAREGVNDGSANEVEIVGSDDIGVSNGVTQNSNENVKTQPEKKN